MKHKMITINGVLDEMEHLDMDDKEYVFSILSKRLVELRRARLSNRVKEAEVNYKTGNVKSGDLKDLWEDLND